MDYKNYLKMLAVSLIVASCSNDDAPANGGITTGTDGRAYLNMAFNLPSRASNSRAGANDQFDDGIASEYQVNSAHLITFIGKDEASAAVSEVINMVSFQPWNNEGTTTDQVTVKREVVQELKVIPTGVNNLYAYVVLNMPHNDVVEKFAAGKTISDIMATEVSSMVGDGSGFIMMNAPLAIASGTSTSVRTLVPVSANHIKPTPVEAQNEGPVEVYLERGVAKVTIGKHDAHGEFNDMPVDPANSPIIVSLDSWAIDYTNTTSYLARNVSEFDTWKDYAASPSIGKRMVGKVAVTNATNSEYKDAYRIYWAKDPNYDSAADDALTRIVDNGAEVQNAWDKVEYPMENTFDIENQMQNNVTRLVFKASIKLKNNDAGSTVFQLSTDGKIYRIDNLRAHITNIIKYVMGDDTNVKLVENSELSFYSTAGSVMIDKSDLSGTFTDEQFTTISNNVGTITTYLDGVCYYTTSIMHFGEELTPWDKKTDPSKYDSAERWLGRYGVLRNNWYMIDVEKISTLGSATVPDPVNPDVPVDEKNYHIDVNCNIFSWAKRVQSVDL